MSSNIEIILLDNEVAYKEQYMKIYIGEDKAFFLWGIPVTFDERDFDHIFFESGEGGEKKAEFSQRRARNMMIIKHLLSEECRDKEVMYQEARETVAIFCKSLDCVVYLRARPGAGKLQISTFFVFGENHTKGYTRRVKTCVPITREVLEQMISEGK